MTVTRKITNVQLHKLMVATLRRAIIDKSSFLHRPDHTQQDIIPLKGSKVLLAELQDRTADRRFYVGWLSTMNNDGVKVDIFGQNQADSKGDLMERDRFYDGAAAIVGKKDTNGRLRRPFTKLEALFSELEKTNN